MSAMAASLVTVPVFTAGVSASGTGVAQGPVPAAALRERLRPESMGAAAPGWLRFLPAQLRLGNHVPGSPTASTSTSRFSSIGSVARGRESDADAVAVRPRRAERGGDRAPPPERRQPSDDVAEVLDPSPTASVPEFLASSVAGRVWALSQDVRGCRRVQQALDLAGDGVREALADELRGHVMEAAQNSHGNYVLQKVIAVLRTEALQFVVDELAHVPVARIAQHKYGCRILQRLIEKCPKEQIAGLVEELLEDVHGMSRHHYSNYVMQVLARDGAQEHRRRMFDALRANLRLLGNGPYCLAVVNAALASDRDGEALKLARALASSPGLMAYMAVMRHGACAVLQALQLLTGEERHHAILALADEAPQLRDSKHGAVVAEFIDAHSAEMLESLTLAGA